MCGGSRGRAGGGSGDAHQRPSARHARHRVVLDHVAGTSTTLKLTGDTSGTITVTDTAALEAVPGGLDGDETCLPPIPTDPPSTDPTPPWTCTLAQRFNVNLGVGDDTVDVGDNLPPLAINGQDGSDTGDFRSGTGGKTVDLTAGTATGMTLPASRTPPARPQPMRSPAPRPPTRSTPAAAALTTFAARPGNDTLKAAWPSTDAMLYGGPGADKFFGGASTQYLALDGVQDTITCSTDKTTSSPPTSARKVSSTTSPTRRSARRSSGPSRASRTRAP